MKIFNEKEFDNLANEILNTAEKLQNIYWEKHKAFSETSYIASQEQMAEAQRLGKLAEAINYLRSGQGRLRHVTGNSIV